MVARRAKRSAGLGPRCARPRSRSLAARLLAAASAYAVASAGRVRTIVVIAFRHVDSPLPFLWEDDVSPPLAGTVMARARRVPGRDAGRRRRSSSATRRSPTPPSSPESRARIGGRAPEGPEGEPATGWERDGRRPPSYPECQAEARAIDRAVRADSWRRPRRSGRVPSGSRPMVVFDPHGREPSGSSCSSVRSRSSSDGPAREEGRPRSDLLARVRPLGWRTAASSARDPVGSNRARYSGR